MSERSLGDRAAKLTPREWRVIALVLEGMSTQAACNALGIAPGTLESHKQAIRRKLAIPRQMRIERFLRDNLGELPVPQPAERRAEEQTPTPDQAERRVRWLLRITLQELAEVSASANLRAHLLQETVKRVGSPDPGDATREIRDLEMVGREVSETYRTLLERVRAPEGG